MLKRYTFPLVVAMMLVISFSLSSCYYDKEETLYGGGVCDTTAISFSQTVVPVLSVYCYRCHSAVNAPLEGQGLILEGYDNISIFLQQNDQKFINSVKQNGLSKPMPPDSKMDKCSIAFLEAWVLQGKKNN